MVVGKKKCGGYRLAHSSSFMEFSVAEDKKPVKCISGRVQCLAQGLLQVPGVRHDAQHAHLQGLREAALLRGVSIPSFTPPDRSPVTSAIGKSGQVRVGCDRRVPYRTELAGQRLDRRPTASFGAPSTDVTRTVAESLNRNRQMVIISSHSGQFGVVSPEFEINCDVSKYKEYLKFFLIVKFLRGYTLANYQRVGRHRRPRTLATPDKSSAPCRHVPKAKHTTIAETPELKRIAENTKLQSNVKYHADFERSKGKFTQASAPLSSLEPSLAPPRLAT
ncbi:LIM and SH3 domain protein Lasp [Eumeta japonica]|uniref:LIM and SH3 domain protein Lasp n=1 Tax=Eumeta variegata TaxID=151549 RepID=A0A4C1W3V4_EUMVA|nr:LIM and SH3 domain protein Lasp [Eumeta japonica]